MVAIAVVPVLEWLEVEGLLEFQQGHIQYQMANTAGCSAEKALAEEGVLRLMLIVGTEPMGAIEIAVPKKGRIVN